MNQSTNLVKYTSADLERAEIVTDSKIVAKNAQIEHKSVRLQIDKHLKALQVFGKLEFSDVKSINPQGGRPEKIYLLNEHQAMLLFTFLKNTATVVKFKVKLVKMFALMQKELARRKVTREIAVKARKSLTDIIRDEVPDSTNKRFAYKHYTDLVYKVVLGMNAKKFEVANEIPRGKIRDYLTENQIKKIEDLETLVKGLLKLKTPYANIKEILREGLRHAC